MSYERLAALAEAHARREAMRTLELMVACQGDEKSWNGLRDAMKKILKTE